jgi:hypothetical protein
MSQLPPPNELFANFGFWVIARNTKTNELQRIFFAVFDYAEQLFSPSELFLLLRSRSEPKFGEKLFEDFVVKFYHNRSPLLSMIMPDKTILLFSPKSGLAGQVYRLKYPNPCRHSVIASTSVSYQATGAIGPSGPNG